VLGPAIFSAALIAALVVLIGFVRQQSRAEQLFGLQRAMQVANESLQLRLDGNRNFLELLARMRATDQLDLDTFQQIESRYVVAHPELINFTWVDERLLIQSASSLETNRQIVGLPITLPESARAADIARSTRQPVYTRPFEAIQDNPSFEIWVPVFHNDHFLGLFVGVYSAQQFLDYVMPKEVVLENQIQLLDVRRSVLATIQQSGAVPNVSLRLEQDLVQPGDGMRLELTRYDGQFWNWGILGATAMVGGLALAMLITMTSLRREVAERRRSQDRLNEINRNLEAMVSERTAELHERYRQLDEARGALEQIAYMDVLTALPNRRRFMETLERLMMQGGRRRERFTCLLLDLDRFKQINESFGHDGGDALLVEAAARFRTSIRDSDFVARLGGDEFAILLSPGYDREGVDTVCQRIIDAFAAPIVFNEQVMRTSPSIGVVLCPDDGETQESLLKSADIALDRARHAGRNTWCWFDHASSR